MQNAFVNILLPHPRLAPQEFLQTYFNYEHNYFLKARNAQSGISLDGYDINSYDLSPRNWTAASKEALDLAVLTKGLAGDAYALELISRGNMEEATATILTILQQKITSYENYKTHKEYAKYKGFIGWPNVTDNGFVVVDPANYSIPSLDNGEWLWSLYALCKQLDKLKDSPEIAYLFNRYTVFLDGLTWDMKEVFFDASQHKLRGNVITENRVIGDETSITYVNEKYKGNQEFFSADIHESIMAVFFMVLFAENLTAEEKKKLWHNLWVPANDTTYGLVYQGAYEKDTSAPHTKWAFLFLPFLDIPIAEDIYKRQEQLRTSRIYNKHGITASANTYHSQKEKYVFQEYNMDVKAPYGTFPLLQYYALQGKSADTDNVGLDWLHYMLSMPGMFGEYGGLESYTLDNETNQHTVCNILTADGKMLIWLSLMGGLVSEIRQALINDGKYEIFKQLTEQNYTRLTKQSNYNLFKNWTGDWASPHIDRNRITRTQQGTEICFNAIDRGWGWVSGKIGAFDIDRDSRLFICATGNFELILQTHDFKSYSIKVNDNLRNINLNDLLDEIGVNGKTTITQITIDKILDNVIIKDIFLYKRLGFTYATKPQYLVRINQLMQLNNLSRLVVEPQSLIEPALQNFAFSSLNNIENFNENISEIISLTEPALAISKAIPLVKEIAYGKTGLFRGHKSDVAARDLVKKCFKDKAKLGVSSDNGDCFFDSAAQSLNSIKKENYSAKSLRLLCHDYVVALDKKPREENWIYQRFLTNVNGQYPDDQAKAITTAVISYHDYMANIRFTAEEIETGSGLNRTTAIWGEQDIDGRILRECLEINLHVLELHDHNNSLILGHQLNDRSVEEEAINYEMKNTIHLAVFNNHFVPIESKDFNIEQAIAKDAGIHEAETSSNSSGDFYRYERCRLFPMQSTDFSSDDELVQAISCNVSLSFK